MMQTFVHSVGEKATGQQPAGGSLPAAGLRAQRRPGQKRAGRPAQALAGDLASGSQQLGQMLSLGALALGAALAFSQRPPLEEEGSPECPKCGGSGTEECWCTRWSDGDVGCASCGGSGRTVCTTCSGGGRAVRLHAKNHIVPQEFRGGMGEFRR